MRAMADNAKTDDIRMPILLRGGTDSLTLAASGAALR
jgi:hypothetical protein